MNGQNTPQFIEDRVDGYQEAIYVPQRLPQFIGNPLIEALPSSPTDEQLATWMMQMPPFDAAQRGLETFERIQMLVELKRFMLAMGSNLELARYVDSVVRAGYVGRSPKKPEYAQIFQRIYAGRAADVETRAVGNQRLAQLSALLVGVSGMGKTSSLKHFVTYYPKVIHHRELNIYQVPCLHIETPADGASVKGLAHSILVEMDKRIPGADYYQTFAGRGRPSTEALMVSVKRVLHMHCVGFMVLDEVQNLMNAPTGGQRLMSQLVSFCNDLGVPILFVGTNKSAKLFKLDFRSSRRASGEGIAPWDRLHETVEEGGENEWRNFVEVLWHFQWTRKPVALTEEFLSTLYHYSQGVIDIVIKLFAVAQARAMLDGGECITVELITAVYNEQFKLLHKMIEALRDSDYEKLALYEDVAPVKLEAVLSDFKRRALAKTSKAFSVKPKSESFEQLLAAALMAAGMPEDEAIGAAAAVVERGTAKNLLEGAKQAFSDLTAVKKVRPKTGLPKKSAGPDIPEEPFADDDYRRAGQLAREQGTSVMVQAERLGHVVPLEELVSLA